MRAGSGGSVGVSRFSEGVGVATDPGVAEFAIRRVSGPVATGECDRLAVEAHLLIRLTYGESARRATISLSRTMRTPGQDEELVAGHLMAEGLIRRVEDIVSVRPYGLSGGAEGPSRSDRTTLAPGVAVDAGLLGRHSYTSSACDVSLDKLRLDQFGEILTWG